MDFQRPDYIMGGKVDLEGDQGRKIRSEAGSVLLRF